MSRSIYPFHNGANHYPSTDCFTSQRHLFPAHPQPIYGPLGTTDFFPNRDCVQLNGKSRTDVTSLIPTLDSDIPSGPSSYQNKGTAHVLADFTRLVSRAIPRVKGTYLTWLAFSFPIC